MDSALIDRTSEQFLGQWQRLVSTTNWEKGRIICEWRETLRASETPAAEYSDDAWSRRVGNVTPQHVGRLRRASERFGTVRHDYPGLFWSHFQAALDWDDAEMWLEGAVHSGWSISEMRHQRWEALGGIAQAPHPQDDDSDILDEDADAVDGVVSGTLDVVRAPEPEDQDFEISHCDDEDATDDDGEPAPSIRPEPIRPFASLPPLPADVSDAFEAYKLCILRHRLDGWREISRGDLLVSLDALKQLALAPAE